jgi:hypothetical protein
MLRWQEMKDDINTLSYVTATTLIAMGLLPQLQAIR